jgi:hypothetical protein
MQNNSLSKSPKVGAIVVQSICNLVFLAMPIFFIPAYAHHKGCISCPQPSCKHLINVEKWLNAHQEWKLDIPNRLKQRMTKCAKENPYKAKVSNIIFTFETQIWQWRWGGNWALIPTSHWLDLNTKCKHVPLPAIELQECKTPCLFCWYMFLMQPCVLFVSYLEHIFKIVNWAHMHINSLLKSPCLTKVVCIVSYVLFWQCNSSTFLTSTSSSSNNWANFAYLNEISMKQYLVWPLTFSNSFWASPFTFCNEEMISSRDGWSFCELKI